MSEPIVLPACVRPEHKPFVDRLLDVGMRKYHDKHPFHRAMNEGLLDARGLQVWAINRFYYQRVIPRKDGAILSSMTDPAMRRRWIERIHDQDGQGEGSNSGLDGWLALVEATGATREQAWDDANVLPGVRFAVDAYLHHCRTRPWIEAVAASLTELFAPSLHALRIDTFPEHYPWLDERGYRYFRSRLSQARRDVEHGLDLVLTHCVTKEQQDVAVGCLDFKCDLLWSMLDAIEHACPLPSRKG